MDIALIYNDKNGRARVILADPNFKQSKETEECALGRLYLFSGIDCIEFIACSQNKIPTDLYFREAWEKGDSASPIHINFDKALAIHRENLRQAALRKIDQLNLQLQLAEEKSNLPEQVAIKGMRGLLRDVHEMNLTHCKSVEDIKNAVPKELRDVWTYYCFD